MSNSKRLQRVLALCSDVLDRPGAERMAYLAKACHGDFRLRASVESVLVALKDARQFMDVADIRADNFVDFVGESAGEYRLTELLGISPLGAVYRATDDKGHDFAVRVVRGHLWARELIERFTDELDIYSRIRHPGIAALLDGGVTVNGSPYVVYEFVDGVSIDEYCDRHRLDVRQRVAMLRRVCLAAHAGHAHLTAWRSLRPSNVLVTADGVPKLLDFALATLLHRQHGPVLSNDTTMKSMWASQFAAPETYEGVTQSVTADVYSLGAMAFELLTGQRPQPVQPDEPATAAVARASEQVRGNTDWALRKAIAHRRSTSPRALARALTGNLDAVLDKALRRLSTQRFDSASAFARALTKHLNRQPLHLDDDRLRSGSWSKSGVFVVGLVLGATAAGGLAYLHFIRGLF
jgi:serine/threonine-protein kinase